MCVYMQTHINCICLISTARPASVQMKPLKKDLLRIVSMAKKWMVYGTTMVHIPINGSFTMVVPYHYRVYVYIHGGDMEVLCVYHINGIKGWFSSDFWLLRGYICRMYGMCCPFLKRCVSWSCESGKYIEMFLHVAAWSCLSHIDDPS